MSEKLHNNNPEQMVSHEQHKDLHEKIKNTHELGKEAKNTNSEQLEAIRQSIEIHTQKAEKHTGVKQEHAPHHERVTRELKAIKYKETLRYMRRHLKPGERKMSKLIHQPTIEKISEVGAKTVARPSGILGGGLFALFGSTTALWFAKQYGFEVPNSIFIVLLIIGFAVGVALEFVLKMLPTKKRKHRSY